MKTLYPCFPLLLVSLLLSSAAISQALNNSVEILCKEPCPSLPTAPLRQTLAAFPVLTTEAMLTMHYKRALERVVLVGGRILRGIPVSTFESSPRQQFLILHTPGNIILIDRELLEMIEFGE